MRDLIRNTKLVKEIKIKKEKKAQHPAGFEPHDLLMRRRKLYHCATTAILTFLR